MTWPLRKFHGQHSSKKIYTYKYLAFHEPPSMWLQATRIKASTYTHILNPFLCSSAEEFGLHDRLLWELSLPQNFTVAWSHHISDGKSSSLVSGSIYQCLFTDQSLQLIKVDCWAEALPESKEVIKDWLWSFLAVLFPLGQLLYFSCSQYWYQAKTLVSFKGDLSRFIFIVLILPNT